MHPQSLVLNMEPAPTLQTIRREVLRVVYFLFDLW